MPPPPKNDDQRIIAWWPGGGSFNKPGCWIGGGYTTTEFPLNHNFISLSPLAIDTKIIAYWSQGGFLFALCTPIVLFFSIFIFSRCLKTHFSLKFLNAKLSKIQWRLYQRKHRNILGHFSPKINVVFFFFFAFFLP